MNTKLIKTHYSWIAACNFFDNHLDVENKIDSGTCMLRYKCFDNTHSCFSQKQNITCPLAVLILALCFNTIWIILLEEYTFTCSYSILSYGFFEIFVLLNTKQSFRVGVLTLKFSWYSWNFGIFIFKFLFLKRLELWPLCADASSFDESSSTPMSAFGAYSATTHLAHAV